MTLLQIRFIQIKRELTALGLRTIILVALVAFLAYASFIAYQKTPEAYYLTAFLFFICLSLQSYRNDKEFVYNHIQNPHLEIYLEYAALTFPFAISAIFTPNWICYPILLASLGIIPFFKYNFTQRTYFKNISSVIPASQFEWISGFRKSFPILIALYILAIAFCWFKIAPLLFLWFITISIASFYTECEPLQILKEGDPSAKAFLREKLYQHSKYIVLLYTPILLINTFFNPDYMIINALFIPVQLALLWFAICLKYSTYRPNTNSAGNNIVLSFVSIGSIIPYFLPVPLIMTYVHYKKAKNNLRIYLND